MLLASSPYPVHTHLQLLTCHDFGVAVLVVGDGNPRGLGFTSWVLICLVMLAPHQGLCSLSGTSPLRQSSHRILSTCWGFGCHSTGPFFSLTIPFALAHSSRPQILGINLVLMAAPPFLGVLFYLGSFCPLPWGCLLVSTAGKHTQASLSMVSSTPISTIWFSGYKSKMKKQKHKPTTSQQSLLVSIKCFPQALPSIGALLPTAPQGSF